ncbi:unnamed protein product (mitochondrion) [Plasmodiophora brassicae]|uniref:DNA replication complex GINS protein PSF2 n=1 Tax=Plasmodiophora brassicae TaxID=37360 RepID=A0A0G4IJU3_PLABS|nr:hypothetical protein PBRA_004118 [Plasmodiophora brassicae]SPQ96197.1 unnamed protein product [Plasmodiophora brassicae]
MRPPLSNAEVEFLATGTVVTISPRFNLERLRLWTGGVGPVRLNQPVQVPLWVALHLKRSRKCSILCPSWLNLQYINERIEQERADDLFTDLPEHYLEAAALLFKHAPDDIPNVVKVKAALNALESIRVAKLRVGLQEIQPGFTFAKLNNVTLMEIQQIRSYTSAALDQLYDMSQEKFLERTGASSQSQAETQQPSLNL